MKIGFLFGTETGNAEMVCEDIQADFGDDYETTLADLADTTPDDLDPDVFYIIVTSTYGNGDLPTTAQPFGEALEAKPDLTGVRFAIFGLGDMVFAETFNNGSKTLAALLTSCNATQVGERGLFDASSADLPEDIAIPWAHACLAQTAELAA